MIKLRLQFGKHKDIFKLVTLGSPEGCFQLAENYYRGTIIQKSNSEAFRLYQKSGDLGFHEAFTMPE